MKKPLLISVAVLGIWIIFAQGCLTFRMPDKKAVAAFREKGIHLSTTTILVGGHRIHYVQTGKDNLPTLVFIHGTPGSWTAFEPYLKDSLLLSRFRLISFDRPGFGYSDYGNALPLAEQSELLAPVIRSLRNGKPMWLIGHSLGGPLLLQLELDNPGLSTGLVLISGSIDPKAEKPERWRPILFKTPLNILVPGAMRPSNVELWYLKNDLKELTPRLPGIHCPVYFIHGREDTWVPPSNVAFGLSRLTGTSHLDTLWMEGNHFIPWTRFEIIRDKLFSLAR
jgi:pimeloyl-ACP methyl ester carboxylesterase